MANSVVGGYLQELRQSQLTAFCVNAGALPFALTYLSQDINELIARGLNRG
jgi:hypothetical protein